MALTTESFASQVSAAQRTRIYEVMTREPVLVRDDLALEGLVELLRERGLSRVPVVSADGRLVGIVSKTDVVEHLHARGDTDEVDQRGAEPDQHVHALGAVVRDVMSRTVLSLPATTPLLEAARRMLASNVHAVPVTSESDGRVIGILSTTDVVAWVAGVPLGAERPRPDLRP